MQPDPKNDLDPVSLAAIRALMDAEPAPQGAEATRNASTKEILAQDAKPQAPVAPIKKKKWRKADVLPEIAPQMDEEAGDAPRKRHASKVAKKPESGRFASKIEALKAKVTGYRPTPRHILLGCLLVLIVMRPWLVVGFVLLIVFVFTVIFLILGYDGFWHRSMALGRWYAKRRPKRTAELHGRMDLFAVRWDAFLDRFPEGTVDGLYLPDFGALAQADARHEEALERRLDGLRNDGA
ncbi:hypothetical protein C1J03_03145 [Sulfitobacter sp. SK012]|uniref:heme biosynthesis HemY N-terminal domain-containing protein n=1 Tax=Sulfitobacter sp. SK012 TaxID=1389005 RepID=UPI000E0A3204|nr:heme biosynthesis HemY N-terminal domain-containing protein [Sulfitobacter sp. SK012]AXI45119.1 hypothetical protein C1J03_03145 [Sulfitobacter sp. SK012]